SPMIDVRSEAKTHFRRRRISLRLRLRSLRKVCSSLIASAGTAESGINWNQPWDFLQLPFPKPASAYVSFVSSNRARNKPTRRKTNGRDRWQKTTLDRH